MIVFGLSKVLADPGNFSVRENLMRRRFVEGYGEGRAITRRKV